MLGLRAGTVLNFILGRQYAGIPQQIDVTKSASLVERAPAVITETVMESLIVVVPKTTTVQVTYHVPLNTSTSAIPDTSATLPFASTAIANATSSTFDPAQDTPLFAINPSLILPETQESEPIPTTAADGDALPGTSEANETAAPIETATTEEAPAELTAEPTSEPTSEPASEPASEPISEPTSEGAPKETPDEARLVSEQETTSSEVLLFDTESLTFTGPPGLSTTLQTRSGTTTAASAPESTQSSDVTPDDDDTGITDPRPSFTTATLPGGLITTIGLDPTGNDQASETDGSDVISKESDDSATTPVVVGSVVGSVMGLSMLVFLFWFLRRRATRRRRSTLLTPLGIPPGPPGGVGSEKYEIDNHSLGPTPRSTKLAAAVSVNAKKFGRRLRLSTSGAPGVNMNRGNSQFLDSNPSHSRSASMGPYPSSRGGSSSEGHQGWWSRLILESSAENIEAQESSEKERGTTRSPSPNPFSDAHTMAAVPPVNQFANARDSLVPSPLAPGRSPPQRPRRPDDPFSDSNSIAPLGPTRLPPATYVTDVQRSRGPSMMARNLTPPGPNGTPNLAPPTSREAWRDNIHSNPFDLELDGRHVPSVSNIHPMPPRYTAASSVYGMPKRATTHSRAESFTSRYTSGVSMVEEWPMTLNDSRYSGAGYPPYRHSRSESDSVLGRQSVGQAM